MNSFEKTYLGMFGLILVLLISYWGRLAWFYPDKLKQRLMEDAKKNPNWLFVRGYSLKFTDKYGVLMVRFVTSMMALSILIIIVKIIFGI